MNLSPREKDKLLISMAAMVARRRLERGVKLNHPEAIAIISDFIVEGARDGRTVADLMQAGGEGITRAPGHAGGGDVPRGHQARPGAGADQMRFMLSFRDGAERRTRNPEVISARFR